VRLVNQSDKSMKTSKTEVISQVRLANQSDKSMKTSKTEVIKSSETSKLRSLVNED
jgi:hypothetical protein